MLKKVRFNFEFHSEHVVFVKHIDNFRAAANLSLSLLNLNKIKKFLPVKVHLKKRRKFK